MRQAVLAALNCDDILMASYGNEELYELNAGWCVPTDAQWGTDAGSEYYNQQDAEKAKKLMKEAGYNNEPLVLVTTEHRADPKQFSMYITSNSYNMLPIQLSVLDSGWAGLNAPEVAEGIKAIRQAASEEEAAAAWEELQSFLYEYGAATVLGHYTGVTAMNEGVEGVNYLRFNTYWGAGVSK